MRHRPGSVRAGTPAPQDRVPGSRSVLHPAIQARIWAPRPATGRRPAPRPEHLRAPATACPASPEQVSFHRVSFRRVNHRQVGCRRDPGQPPTSHRADPWDRRPDRHRWARAPRTPRAHMFQEAGLRPTKTPALCSGHALRLRSTRPTAIRLWPGIQLGPGKRLGPGKPR